jgi:hypothetical protein
MNVLLVVEPVVTPDVVDVIVMVSGDNVTLGFPKNAMSVVVGEVYVVPLIVFVGIMTVRFAEVPVNVLAPIAVTELGITIELKFVQL